MKIILKKDAEKIADNLTNAVYNLLKHHGVKLKMCKLETFKKKVLASLT